MSDFGAIILFKKKEGEFNSDDVSLIEEKLIEVVTEEEFPSNITEGNFSVLKQWEENVYCSMVTEYYDDDDDADEIREFAEEDDIPDCERIIEMLMISLNDRFEMTAKLEEW